MCIRDRLGGEIKFGVQVEDLLVCQGKLAGLIADGQPIACDQLVLAVGHSARDTFEMLMKHQIPMIAKAFSVGLRIEPVSYTHLDVYKRQISC